MAWHAEELCGVWLPAQTLPPSPAADAHDAASATSTAASGAVLWLPLRLLLLLLCWSAVGGGAAAATLAGAGSCCLMSLESSCSHWRGTPHRRRAYSTQVTIVAVAEPHAETHAAIRPVRCMHNSSVHERNAAHECIDELTG